MLVSEALKQEEYAKSVIPDKTNAELIEMWEENNQRSEKGLLEKTLKERISLRISLELYDRGYRQQTQWVQVKNFPIL